MYPRLIWSPNTVEWCSVVGSKTISKNSFKTTGQPYSAVKILPKSWNSQFIINGAIALFSIGIRTFVLFISYLSALRNKIQLFALYNNLMRQRRISCKVTMVPWRLGHGRAGFGDSKFQIRQIHENQAFWSSFYPLLRFEKYHWSSS